LKKEKPAYICGPLTDIPVKQRDAVKRFYSRLGDLFQEVAGIRAFVPHEHYDPVIHPHFTPEEVDEAERRQVCENTSLLVVVAIMPSWGGGIEVEMARESGVPAVLLCRNDHFDEGKISRLLRGNRCIAKDGRVIRFDTEDDAIDTLRGVIIHHFEMKNPVLVGISQL
jgi:hypothetical protein